MAPWNQTGTVNEKKNPEKQAFEILFFKNKDTLPYKVFLVATKYMNVSSLFYVTPVFIGYYSGP